MGGRNIAKMTFLMKRNSPENDLDPYVADWKIEVS